MLCMTTLDLTERTHSSPAPPRASASRSPVDLARAGASVVVNGRKDDGVRRAIDAVEQAMPGASVRGIAAISTEDGAATVLDQLPDVDVLVNNLGIFGSRDPFEITDVRVAPLLRGQTSSRRCGSCARPCPAWSSAATGRVISIASDSAVVTPAEMIHYGMTKTALLAVSRGFAKAVKGSGSP